MLAWKDRWWLGKIEGPPERYRVALAWKDRWWLGKIEGGPKR